MSRAPGPASGGFCEKPHPRSPACGGETVLFVSAGILATGLSGLLAVAHPVLPFERYGVPLAWAGAVAMIVLSLVGVHPVISIGLIAAVVAPLEPEATLFVASSLVGWGAGAAIGPLSGTQMYLQGRYQVDPLATTRANVAFVGVVLALSWPALALVAWLVDVGL